MRLSKLNSHKLNGYWWLRTASDDSSLGVGYVTFYGNLYDYSYDARCGICFMCKII